MGNLINNLPPYHCQYSQTKLKETKEKAEVAKSINAYRFSSVDRLTKEPLDRVIMEGWISCV
jgi:hypothetical protein